MLIRELFNLIEKDGQFGVEIEVEGSKLPFVYTHPAKETKKYWKAVDDGSLRGQESIEYVLKEPLDMPDLVKALDVLMKDMENVGSTIDSSVRAGVHIHLNVQELTLPQLINLITLYYCFEGPLTDFCGEGRQGNLFCLRGMDAEYIVWALEKAFQHNNFLYLNSDDIRYSALNLTSLFKYGSVEFRALRTPQNLIDILAWVKLIDKLFKRSQEYDNPMDIVLGLSQDGGEAFLRNTFGELAQLLNLENLEERIRPGVLNAQDIAFGVNCEELAALTPDDMFDVHKEKNPVRYFNERRNRRWDWVDHRVALVDIMPIEDEGDL